MKLPGTAENAAPLVSSNPLLSGAILPTLWRLSLPNMIAMLATALVAVAETAYVGFLGTPALAGLAMVFPMVMLQQMLSAGAMGGGISSAISRALGAGDRVRAEKLAFHAFVIGALAGVVFTIFFLAAGEPIYRLLGGKDEGLAAALSYSNIVFLGATAIWLTNTCASILRGSGNMKVPSLALFCLSGAQVILGGSLGFGLGPFPRFGMAGIAAGQVIAFGGAALVLLWFLTSGRARVRLRILNQKLEGAMFKDILKVGALACISPFQTVLTILVVTRLVSEFGTEALAGYGIGTRLEFLLIPITFAIGVACVPMVGMAIGAGDVTRARRVAWTGGWLSGGIMGALGIVAALFPNLWTGLFSTAPAVMASAASYFAWAGPCYGLFGAGLCLYFASQGAGKVLGPVLAGTVRLLIVAFGGWILARNHAPAYQMFALVGVAMLAYGLVTAFSIYISKWGPKTA